MPATKANVVTAALRRFLRRKALVRLRSTFGQRHELIAYVAGVGPQLSLLLDVNDDIRFDGFRVVRNRDIRNLRLEPNANFVETVLRRRRDRRPPVPRIQLHGLSDAIRSAGRCFPLVTLLRERVDPNICHIGAVVEVGKQRVTLREISTSGRWESGLDSYALREITSLEFGGAYEEALALAGGPPPERGES